MVLLRDGKTLIGILRSIDQFGGFDTHIGGGKLLKLIEMKDLYQWLIDYWKVLNFVFLLSTTANLVLHRTIERIYVGNKYGDIARGIFIVRGENVALCGEIVSCREPERERKRFGLISSNKLELKIRSSED